jgi:hypothetical protein
MLRWEPDILELNEPRALMARGRDATDVAIVTSFAPCILADFKVINRGCVRRCHAGKPPRSVVARVDHSGSGILRREALQDDLVKHARLKEAWICARWRLVRAEALAGSTQ